MILQSQPSGADAWLVVAAPTSLLALPSSESARVADLAARLGGPDGFRAALEALVGNGIASAPPFALLDGDAAVLRVVLRGDAAVAAQVADSEVGFSGAGMATWTERVVEGASSVRLTVPGSSWIVRLEGIASLAGAPDAGPATAPAENTWAPNAARETEVPAPVPTPAPTPAPTSAPASAPAPAVSAPAAAPALPQPVLEEPQADPDSEAYDFLFGDTIYRTQAGASIRIPNPDPERPGDHDGHTMLAVDLRRPPTEVGAEPIAGSIADAMPAAMPDAMPHPIAEAVSEATVLAPIPPRSTASPELEHAPSLPLGPTLQLERADGTRESLNRPVLIGRSPSASGTSPDARLIAIADDPDISRTHLRVAVEGDAVVVTDLGSKNGSVITLPGASPRKLRASEPTVVLPGTLIDLGGGTTFTVRED